MWTHKLNFFFTEKPVFTIGTPAISDTDNFSDISLDRDPSTDATTTPAEPIGFYSPLAELDSMGNLQAPPTLNLGQDQQQVDGNLNPLSAALAQLPNAASTVFSTFSSIIKGSAVHEQVPFEPEQEPPANPYGFIYSESVDVNAPPPSFFSPTDDSLFKKTTAEPAINNTFRLGGHKKKTYAHIPGLSSNQQQQTIQAAVPNVSMPPLPPQPVSEAANSFQDYQNPYANQYQMQQPVIAVNPIQPQIQQKEPEKSIFSLTSLLPSQLLEKIPSTKNLFGLGDAAPSYDQQQQSYNENFTVATNFDSTPNFFAPPPQDGNQFPNGQAQNAAPINFFNPQQFVTSPFSQLKVSEHDATQAPGSFSSAANVFSSPPTAPASIGLPAPPTVQPPPTLNAVPLNPPVFTQSAQLTNLFNQTSNDPPKIDANAADINQPPPTFFNPVEASDLFKLNQVDDGRPKNPYSSSRISRGVGMYKTKQQGDTSTAQNVVMPPMPDASSFQQAPEIPMQFEQKNTTPQGPPSVPPIAGNFEQNHQLPVSFPPPILQSNFEPAVVQDFSRPPSRKKSDLNIPDQTSALNFFQSHPVVQAAPIESIPQFNNNPSINFFNDQFEVSAPVMESKSVENFFSNDACKAPQQNNLEIIQAPTFESSSDMGDKIDSMSENIGSTLSLFATSELDASLVQKPSAPLESLIPKYLDTQVRASPSPAPNKTYRPVYRHWFYQNLYWHPFSMSDSLALDEALTSEKEIVISDGGRFEVNLKEKRRSSVYWSSGSNAVRRCSWFYKNPSGTETNLIPFDEATADFMESEFEKAMVGNFWNHRLQIPDTDDVLVIKDAVNIDYHQMGQVLSVKRGVDEFVIDDGEEAAVDHLILSVSNFGDKIDDSGKQ